MHELPNASRGNSRKTNLEAQSRSFEFVIKNVDQSLTLIESQISIELRDVEDSIIQNANKNVPELVKSMEKLSVDLRNLIRDTTGTTKEEKVSRLQTKFEHLATKLRTHTQLVKKELSEREIDKLSSFKDSVLKIKLSKFGGFDSKIDIYSFQTEF